MPRLSPVPRPPAPPGGYEPSPIDPDYDRYYVLDADGRPVRVFDYREHTAWVCHEGRGWDIRDDIPNSEVRVRTYFSGWASLCDAQPPMFRTVVVGFGSSKYFETPTWEEAKAMHARMLAKAARKVAEREKERAGHREASPESPVRAGASSE
ncbi:MULTISPECIES: hypothetical protein [unclassified Cupriavidus]|uniref:hypothetical protein n=1 Tax=unclassified Cupriavidus TaxID=2640874 RepID=UPI00313AB69D